MAIRASLSCVEIAILGRLDMLFNVSPLPHALGKVTFADGRVWSGPRLVASLARVRYSNYSRRVERIRTVAPIVAETANGSLPVLYAGLLETCLCLLANILAPDNLHAFVA